MQRIDRSTDTQTQAKQHKEEHKPNMTAWPAVRGDALLPPDFMLSIPFRLDPLLVIRAHTHSDAPKHAASGMGYSTAKLSWLNARPCCIRFA